MKTPLDTRGSRANDGKSARLGKKQPDGTHAHRIAHPAGARCAGARAARARPARAHSGQRPVSRARNTFARGNLRVSSFPLTGGPAAPIPTGESSGPFLV